METNIIWHYTTEKHAMEIFRDQVIKVSPYDKMIGGKPSVWFSKQQYWEPTACKVFDGVTNDWLGGKKGMRIQNEIAGIVRFGVKYDPKLYITWEKYKYCGKINMYAYFMMENSGIARGGNPSDWLACFSNVRSNYWVAIEWFDGKKFVPVEIQECQQPSVLNAA